MSTSTEIEPAGEAPRDHDPCFNIFESPWRELFARIVEEEKDFVAPESYVNDEAKKALRRTAVAMVESLCSNCLDALVPYVAMTYFDRFFSRRGAEIPDGNETLFAICCVTLAWKFRNKSFRLARFLNDNDLVEQYRTHHVLEMELQICRALNWRMRTMTPFYFVDFYIPFLSCPPHLPAPRHIVHSLIIRSQCDISFAEIRPSVLAVCAVLVVSSKMFPDQHDLFERKIITGVEPLRRQRKMVRKCCRLLEPFYRNPLIRKPRNVPINPQAEAGESSFQATSSQPMPIPGPGAEASSSQAQAQPAADYNRDDVDDVLMDFELGWDEWLKECEVRDAQLPKAWISGRVLWGAGSRSGLAARISRTRLQGVATFCEGK